MYMHMPAHTYTILCHRQESHQKWLDLDLDLLTRCLSLPTEAHNEAQSQILRDFDDEKKERGLCDDCCCYE